MADPVLHIKDSYYFEVPKVLYPYDLKDRRQFPEIWISLDPTYQDWEFGRLYDQLAMSSAGLPSKEQTLEDWHHWVHADHASFAKPFKEFLEEKYQSYLARFQAWKAAQEQEARKKNDGSIEDAKRLTFDDYLKQLQPAEISDGAYLKFLAWRHENAASFTEAKTKARDIQAWKEDKSVPDWSKEKIKAYNGQLSGRILIPQPFGTLRNFYEKESGFAISKYMILEVVIGLILVLLFAQLAKEIEHGRPARGKFWNLLESFLVFIRDQNARPVLGSHDHGHEVHAELAAHGHGEHAHDVAHEPVHAADAHAHAHADPASRYVPLLWTIFFFVLGCNLMGLVPWAGSPTAAWSVTLALAFVTFVTVWASGFIQFGLPGLFFLNHVPCIDLLAYLGIVLKPMIYLIEVLGLLIKHAVLSVRLLANMVAGHLVILGVMGLAFGAEAALYYSTPTTPGWQWWLTATIAVVGAAAFNILELFVAFLQAYIFTFLSRSEEHTSELQSL